MNGTIQHGSKIQLTDPEDDPRWDRFVGSHPYGWICHLSGWKDALEKSFRHMKGYYFALVDGNDNIRAALLVFYVRSMITGRRVVSLPFATLCDPLAGSLEELQELVRHALAAFSDHGVSYFEIRSFRCRELSQMRELAPVSFFKHHFLKLDEAPQILMKRFHRTCVRQRISRAQKSEISVRFAESESDLPGFYKLYIDTRMRLGLPGHPFRFLTAIWRNFHSNGCLRLLLAEKSGRLVAGIVLFCFKDRVSAEYAASDYSFAAFSPNHLLFWEAINWAYSNGYLIFDFGRTSPLNNSLMDFKQRWGTEVATLPIYYYPENAAVDPEKAEKSWKYRLVSTACRKAPRPFQELIGNFCYAHLG